MIIRHMTSNSKQIQGSQEHPSRKLKVGAFSVKLPTFMPVGTRGAVKGLSVSQVASTGVKILLGNTYHLHLSPGETVVERLGGLAKMNKWPGATLTDSGGFQVFSLGKINKISDDGVSFQNLNNGDSILLTPEKSMRIQHKLGADIIMAFDDVVGLSKTARQRSNEAMERTHLWLERSIKEHKRLSKARKGESSPSNPKLFGIVQGGLSKKDRLNSLEFVQNTDVDGIAIGGLAVGESRQEMYKMLDYLADKYDHSRPFYLMGVGHPTDIRYAIERGIDMFDSVLPTRNARHGSVWITCDAATCRLPEADALSQLSAHGFVEHSSTRSTYRLYASSRASGSPLPASKRRHPHTLHDIQVNLRNAQFASDDGPLQKGCDCTTCQAGYARSYLRHLIKAKETLAGSLISIHNIRYLQKICESYQGKL